MRLTLWPVSIIGLVCAFLIFSLGCTPQSGKVTPPQAPARAAQSPLPAPVSPAPQQNEINNVSAGCPAGSETAIAELRSCCRERNWGKACDGGCWAAGVGEKLAKMCNASQASASDCGQAPGKNKLSQWCAFHYNRRYCGISDTEWISSCKNSGSNTANSSGSDCGKSPNKNQKNDWCNFHYNRRYCGISDADWVQTCTPVQSATSATLSSGTAGTPTPTATPTSSCKANQNRSLPYPPCPQRTSAKTCEEGADGKEEGRYCVWTGP